MDNSLVSGGKRRGQSLYFLIELLLPPENTPLDPLYPFENILRSIKMINFQDQNTFIGGTSVEIFERHSRRKSRVTIPRLAHPAQQVEEQVEVVEVEPYLRILGIDFSTLKTLHFVHCHSAGVRPPLHLSVHHASWCRSLRSLTSRCCSRLPAPSGLTEDESFLLAPNIKKYFNMAHLQCK